MSAGSVCKQESKFLLVKKAITKLYGKPCDLVAGEQGKLWEGRRRKIDSCSDGDRDRDKIDFVIMSNMYAQI